MFTVLYSVKGGQGCTTVAAGLAMQSTPCVLLDPTGDQGQVFDVDAEAGSPGLADVLAGRHGEDLAAALRSVAVTARDRLSLVGPGGSPLDAVPAGRWADLADALRGDEGEWLLDAGNGPAARVAGGADRSVLVTGTSLLAIRRLVSQELPPSVAIIIDQPDHYFPGEKVKEIFHVPAIVLPFDEVAGAAIDAGLYPEWVTTPDKETFARLVKDRLAADS